MHQFDWKMRVPHRMCVFSRHLSKMGLVMLLSGGSIPSLLGETLSINSNISGPSKLNALPKHNGIFLK
jgi:hypothetical protein